MDFPPYLQPQPKAGDPDYEEITPRKPPPPAATKHEAVAMEAPPPVSKGIVCDLCGTTEAMVRCQLCSEQRFCLACDDLYHRHPKRSAHARKVGRSLGLPYHSEFIFGVATSNF